MRKRLVLGALLSAVALLVYAETAQAQFYFGGGGGRRGGSSFGFSTPYFSGYYGRGGGYRGGWYGGRDYGYYGRGGYGWGGYGYGGYGRPYGYYGTPYYGSDGYYAAPSSGYVMEAQPGATQSFYSGPQPGDDRAHIRVMVPDPDAKVWFEDQPTQQAGNDRIFVSPGLENGKEYTYKIRAKFRQNGREVTREREVTVRPGQVASVDFASGSGDRDISGDDDSDARRGSKERDRDIEDRRDSVAPRRSRDAEQAAMTGELVKVGKAEFVMTDKNGKNEHKHRLAPDAEIMIGGRKASVEDLKPGMKIKVVTKEDDHDVAARIEAEGPSSDKAQGAGDKSPPP